MASFVNGQAKTTIRAVAPSGPELSFLPKGGDAAQHFAAEESARATVSDQVQDVRASTEDSCGHSGRLSLTGAALRCSPLGIPVGLAGGVVLGRWALPDRELLQRSLDVP